MNNIEALKSVYTKLGGELTDSYDDIADGIPVNDYSVVSDGIQAVSKVAGSSSGSELFVIPVTWDSTKSLYVTTITQAELTAAIAKDALNIAFDIAVNPVGRRLLRMTEGSATTAAASYCKQSASNSLLVETWKCGVFGSQGFGIYFERVQLTVDNSAHTASTTYTQIPEVI